MAEETKRMILATKNLFYALQVHKKICIRDIDMAATSFAMTVHAIMDYQLDCACSGEPVSEDMIQDYIKCYGNNYRLYTEYAGFNAVLGIYLFRGFGGISENEQD